MIKDPYITLTAALLWLRNHYDVGNPDVKSVVLKRIDDILNDFPATASAITDLQRTYPLDKKLLEKCLQNVDGDE